MSIWFGTVNPFDHWLRIMFGTIIRITLRGLYGFQKIGFRIHLRGLSVFQVTLGLVVPALPLHFHTVNALLKCFKTDNFFLLIYLPFGIILMVVMINKYVPLHCIYCQFCSMHIIL